MRHLIATAAVVGCLTLASAPANAEVIVVDARANSLNGGTGNLTAFVFTAGQAFRVRSSTNDLWSAGDLPRFSDGSGLTGNRNATADDDSGQTPGTLIGVNFGTYSQDGFTAPFGTLVARFGGVGGTYQALGANFDGLAAGSGQAELFYWDSNNGDNTGDISFSLFAGVPEPGTWAMMILGFGMVGGAMRSRRRKVSLSYA
jgi:hypothetical protein